MYVYDLCDNMASYVKLFVDDASLFSVAENEVVGAEQ